MFLHDAHADWITHMATDTYHIMQHIRSTVSLHELILKLAPDAGMMEDTHIYSSRISIRLAYFSSISDFPPWTRVAKKSVSMCPWHMLLHDALSNCLIARLAT